MTALRDSGLTNVEEIGKKWNTDPKHFDNALSSVYTDWEERSKLIRGLNDAEKLYNDSVA
jgi:endonuclease V-like protein UPF0215 family